jgi:hypothetical protein
MFLFVLNYKAASYFSAEWEKKSGITFSPQKEGILTSAGTVRICWTVVANETESEPRAKYVLCSQHLDWAVLNYD